MRLVANVLLQAAGVNLQQTVVTDIEKRIFSLESRDVTSQGHGLLCRVSRRSREHPNVPGKNTDLRQNTTETRLKRSFMELQAFFCVSDVLSFEILRYKSLSLS